MAFNCEILTQIQIANNETVFALIHRLFNRNAISYLVSASKFINFRKAFTIAQHRTITKRKLNSWNIINIMSSMTCFRTNLTKTVVTLYLTGTTLVTLLLDVRLASRNIRADWINPRYQLELWTDFSVLDGLNELNSTHVSCCLYKLLVAKRALVQL